jgi:hypothetical protein
LLYNFTKHQQEKWVGFVACVGEKRKAYRVWWGKLMEREHLENLGINRSIILLPFLPHYMPNIPPMNLDIRTK